MEREAILMYAVDDAVGPQYVLKCGHEHHDSFYSTYLSTRNATTLSAAAAEEAEAEAQPAAVHAKNV